MSIDNNADSTRSNDNISLKRSTFTKIAVGIVALMIASFFGGYTFRSAFYTTTIVPSAGTLGQQQQQPTLQQQPSQMQPQLTKIASVNTDGASVKGKADAPVTMIEFGDFKKHYRKDY